MTKAVNVLLKQFKDQFGDYPKLAQFDDAGSFSISWLKSF